jgi:hypothetical protein
MIEGLFRSIAFILRLMRRQPSPHFIGENEKKAIRSDQIKGVEWAAQSSTNAVPPATTQA